MQIIIVNDLGELFSPVLEFTLSQVDTKITQNNIQLNVSTDISLCSNYFNPRNSAWEPVIEEVSFQVLYNFSEFSQRKQIVAVELNDNQECFNINVSTQFIAVLMQLVNMYRDNNNSNAASNSNSISKSAPGHHHYEEEHKSQQRQTLLVVPAGSSEIGPKSSIVSFISFPL